MSTKKAAAVSATRKSSKTTVNAFRNPYQIGSVICIAWDLAKKGTTVSAIEKLCVKRAVNPSRVLRELKWGAFKASKWAVKFNKAAGTLKIAAA
jgi:hypothetical protein